MKQYQIQSFILFLSLVFLFPTFTQAQKWVQMGKNIEGEMNENLGSSVSLSADGNTIAIGADGSLDVKVYTWNETDWVQKGKIIESEGESVDGFGQVVSLSADGNVLACGTSNQNITEGTDDGYVKVYTWNGTDWVQKGKAINGRMENQPFNINPASSISLSGDGNTLVMNGDYMSIYVWDGQSWIETWKKEVFFDEAVSIAADGKTVAIAAQFEDKSDLASPYRVLILQWNGTEWIQKGSYITPNKSDNYSLGTALSLNAHGESIAIGFTNPDFMFAEGRYTRFYYTKVYEWNGSDWVQKGEDMYTKDERSGYSVSLSADGNTIATRGENLVFVYAWDGQAWGLIQKAIQSKASPFSTYTVSLSADGSIIAIGSSLERKNRKETMAGMVRVFQLKE